MTTTNVVSREQVGARLRIERERRGCSQEQFGSWGGVTRNSQQAYEGGKRAFDVDYLGHLAARGVDVGFIIAGDDDRADAYQIATSLDALAPATREAVLTIVADLAARPTRASVHAPAPAYGAPPAELPSEPALARALEGVLAAYPDLEGAALARALARHLPSAIGAAADHTPDRAAPAAAPADSPPTNRRAPATRQRT